MQTQSSWGRGTETSANLNPGHWMETLWITLKETTDTWCTYPIYARWCSSRCDLQGVRKWLIPCQHRDARSTGCELTATGDLATRWWSSRQSQQRETGPIYLNKREVHGTESVNTQEQTLRHDALDVEEAALIEESMSLRDLESLEYSDTEHFSQSETIGFFEAVEQVARAEPRQGTRARTVPQLYGEDKTHPVVTECHYWLNGTQDRLRSQSRWDWNQ